METGLGDALVALGVDSEMAGKDPIESVTLSSAIARALGGQAPEGFNYELFLDDKGQKISKSKAATALSIDEWLTYASPESLSLFMSLKPLAAKRLYFDAIPRTVDEYLGFLDAYPRQEWKERLGNPAWHIHAGAPPPPERLVHGENAETPVSFSMLLNLAAVANSESPTVLWGFLRRYAPSVSPETHPRLDRLVNYAVAYFRDFVAPKKRYRLADDVETAAFWKNCLQVWPICQPTQARRRYSTRSTMSPGPSRAIRTSNAKARRPSGRAYRTIGSI